MAILAVKYNVFGVSYVKFIFVIHAVVVCNNSVGTMASGCFICVHMRSEMHTKQCWGNFKGRAYMEDLHI
jgi:hypothetical protein